MTTNILATILTLMVTNAAYDPADRQPKWYRDSMPIFDGNGWHTGGQYQNPSYVEPEQRTSKTLITDIYENRLLILEAEGLQFTNILASQFHHQIRETFHKEVVAPKWVSEQTEVNTNDPNAWIRLGGTTNHFIPGSSLIITNNMIYFTSTNTTNLHLDIPKDK